MIATKTYSQHSIQSPFGMVMPGRNWQAATGGGYGFGFQNQEEEDHLKGIKNSINFKYRIYDARLGRFFSLDPLAGTYPYNSPYAFSENVVINCKELEGREKVSAIVYGTITVNDTKVFTAIQIEYDINTKVAAIALGIVGTGGVRVEYNTSSNTLLAVNFYDDLTLDEVYDKAGDIGTIVPSWVVGVVDNWVVDNLGEFNEEIGEANQQLKENGVDVEVNGVIDILVKKVEDHELVVFKDDYPEEIKLVTESDGSQKNVKFDEGTKYSLKTTANETFNIKLFGSELQIEGQIVIQYIDQKEAE